MTARAVLVRLHLVLGLTAGLFLVVLGSTGCIMAFETDIPHWLHADLFYVRPTSNPLPEQELVRVVEQRFAPARAASVQVLRQTNLARVVQLPGGVSVFVNPYTGAILGRVQGGFPCDRILGYIHQIHLRLVPDPNAMRRVAAVGKTVVSGVGVLLALLVPTGAILFWRTRRTTVKWGGSWSRVAFDVHHVVGVYAALFLMLAAVTGILIGFDAGETMIFSLARSGRPPQLAPSQSHPLAGGSPITIDRAIAIARTALPNAAVAGYSLPRNPKGVFTVLLRVPEETSEAVHSSVAIDQFSGQVLQVRNFRTDSAGYYWVRFNRSLHTGDVFGRPTQVLAASSSLMLVVMVLTGLVIWWKRLAV
jgi:uncharacterized iron-regulated membrane protein